MSETASTTSQPVATATDGARILVVDDTEANRDALARRLSRRGYVIETASGGQEALDRLASDPPFDLVLLDVMMPGVSGLDVLEQVRRTRTVAELPIIMATAKDASEDVVKAMGLGANDYVTKPLDFPVVLARVQTQLVLKKSVEQIRQLERDLSERNATLEALNEGLRVAAERTRKDLSLGAKVQASMLPHSVRDVEGFSFAWQFEPCEHLAGDALNICPLGPGVVAMYVLDVVGHGVAASLLSVAAMRQMGDGRALDSMLVRADGSPTPPQEVAEALNDLFPFNAETGQFFTFFYALVDANNDRLTYVSAGHPGAIVVSRAAETAQTLTRSGTPIGIGGGHQQHVVPFGVGDRLFIYSDGVNEAVRPDGERYGIDRLAAMLLEQRTATLQGAIDTLRKDLDLWRSGHPSHDDVTLLAVERVTHDAAAT